jgi:hypothetical protein
MGGFGSGRPEGYGRNKVEACCSIDVNRLHREGCLVTGYRGSRTWHIDGERIAAISVRAEEDRLVLTYNYRQHGDDGESLEEPVPIVRVPCRYGGSRPYFICPGIVNGVSCRRRVAKLYGPGKYFLCRYCYRLAYASQSEGTWDRELRRANKIRTKLGGEPGMLEPFPDRPKGMWNRTYEQLRDEALDAEVRADKAFAMRVALLLSRIDGPSSTKDFW